MENAKMKAAADDPNREVNAQVESELAEPVWAVISFERREASGISFSEAVEIIKDLDARGVSGLCIVTDEAASRIG